MQRFWTSSQLCQLLDETLRMLFSLGLSSFQVLNYIVFQGLRQFSHQEYMQWSSHPDLYIPVTIINPICSTVQRAQMCIPQIFVVCLLCGKHPSRCLEINQWAVQMRPLISQIFYSEKKRNTQGKNKKINMINLDNDK